MTHIVNKLGGVLNKAAEQERRAKMDAEAAAAAAAGATGGPPSAAGVGKTLPLRQRIQENRARNSLQGDGAAGAAGAAAVGAAGTSENQESTSTPRPSLTSSPSIQSL